jgi:hypothetical protein
MKDEIEKLESAPSGIRFSYLVKVCEQYFGKPRITGSHHIFKTPWQGDPRINIQKAGNKAKPYPVEQVIEA